MNNNLHSSIIVDEFLQSIINGLSLGRSNNDILLDVLCPADNIDTCDYCGDTECDCNESLESYDDLEYLWDSILNSK